jgi:hypothetical protein
MRYVLFILGILCALRAWFHFRRLETCANFGAPPPLTRISVTGLLSWTAAAYVFFTGDWPTIVTRLLIVNLASSVITFGIVILGIGFSAPVNTNKPWDRLASLYSAYMFVQAVAVGFCYWLFGI